MMLKIKAIAHNSVAHSLGITRETLILEIDGEALVYSEDFDKLVNYFQECGQPFTLKVKDKGKPAAKHIITLKDKASLGIEVFESEQASCCNNCIFCFMEQLPKTGIELRETLRCKDDDYRLSYSTGNYITLTNATDSDIQTICEYQISPLYISVHATDTKVRQHMLGDKISDVSCYDILSKIEKLVNSGIEMHTQIVLTPSVNDGKVLEQSLQDLHSFYPNIASVAIVPVGLTAHRQGLTPLVPVDKQKAIEVLDTINKFNASVKSSKNSDYVFASDEFYLLAELPLPDARYYQKFPQLENGIGMLTKFGAEFEKELARYKSTTRKITDCKICKKNKALCSKKITIITGTLAFNFISNLVEKVNALTGSQFATLAVVNNFFGDTITVSGLLTFSDIKAAYLPYKQKNIKQCENCDAEYNIVIPENCLNYDSFFLDNYSLDDAYEQIDEFFFTLPTEGKEFAKFLLEIE